MARKFRPSPTVSVVMAHRSGAQFLSEAIASARAQTLEEFELLVSDDGSEDGSRELVGDIAAEDARVRLLTGGPGSGPAATRNRALDEAQGDWIAIFDSDDLMHPERLQRLVSTADELGVDGIADDLIFFGDDAGRTLLEPLGLRAPLALTPDVLLGNEADPKTGVPLGYLKPVIRRAALGDVRYSESLRIGEDFDLLMRLALAGLSLMAVPEGQYLYRRHGKSVSRRLSSADAQAMKAGLTQLKATLGDAPDLNAALERRCQDLDRSGRFAVMIENLKSFRPGAVVAAAAADPALLAMLKDAAIESLTRRLGGHREDAGPRWVALCDGGEDCPSGHEHWDVGPQPLSGEVVKSLASLGDTAALNLHARSAASLHALGYVPGWKSLKVPALSEGWSDAERQRVQQFPWTVTDHSKPVEESLVHVRTPTYRRPASLERALRSLQAQTHENWICDVFDDDPDRSAEPVVRNLGDARIRYIQNIPQRFASANIDQCFSRSNPHRAAFFCVLEDDNQCLPRFMEGNIEALEEQGVEVLLRNQLVEHDAETEDARLSDFGILDRKMSEQVYGADHFRMSLMSDIGVSNGGLFWSHRAKSDLEIHVPCSAAMQEFYRTFAVEEPIFVALKPLAVWAENGSMTTRDHGRSAGRLWREIRFKATVARLRRNVWRGAAGMRRKSFLTDGAFRYPREMRERGLVSSLAGSVNVETLTLRERLRLTFRGGVLRLIGIPERGLSQFLSQRRAARR